MLSSVLGAVLVAMTAGSTPAIAADFFVSPSGNDAWTGRLAAPNRTRTDGPFRTLQAALDAVRQLRARLGTARTVKVLVRQGVYTLDKPLVFGPEHSGGEGTPTVIAAYPGEKPRISGGVRLGGWTVSNGRWTLIVPDVRDGAWMFEQLFVNGNRRYRPRLPKQGYYHIAQAVAPTPENQGKGFDGFIFANDDIRADWHNLEDVHVLCFQSWTMARMRIRSVDTARRTVRFTSPTLSDVWYFALDAGKRYLVENVYEALTEPGEWYLDRKSGCLTYLPAKGEKPDTAEVYAPKLDHLVEFRGNPDARSWVQHVELQGLIFEHTNWVTDPGGYQSAQAEWPIGGAIRAIGARYCRLDGCKVRHVGGYAVEFGHACQQCAVENCEITDMGAGGVKLGLPQTVEDPELLSGHHRVHNNLIAHGGRLHPAGIGVWVGASPYNTISHNEICDLYYTGISVGWSWGYAPTGSHHNILEYNHVHHIGQGVLSDMGATYTLGLAQGTVQRNNVFHDVESYSYGGWGIYFDEGTTGMVAENNLVYACKSAGFHQHYGRDNVVRNNIFAFNKESQIMRTRAEDHLSLTFQRNIVLWERSPLLASNWSGNSYKFESNLYWRTDGQPIDFAGLSLEQWRQKGQDVASLIADPMFVNPRKLDFRLRAGSPAERIGFVPFDYTKAGRVEIGLARTTATLRPRAYPAPSLPPPPGPIVLDFEDHPLGAKAMGATTIEENAEAVIRVTEETAATGRRSLKFVDRPGQQHNYNPHLCFTPGYSEGVVRASFALRVEKGTLMYHQWRHTAGVTHNGPTLRVEPDGSLYAGDRKLIDIPHGTWFRVEIVCPVGKKANGKYDVVIRLPGRTAPLRFPELPCSPHFGRVDWFGFVADADGEGLFYLDDLRVEVRGR